MESFDAFKDILLMAMASGISGFVIWELHQLRNSVQELNLKMAEIMGLKHTVERLEARIEHMEERVR
jgi:ubiquinone biosynthesis protein UbiJ